MTQILISVIVPIYKGKKYIPFIIEQIEKCADQIKKNIAVELLLINDYPDEKLEEYESKKIFIRVINTEINRGIQGARIRGVELSRGVFILMLDQDDRIKDTYLCSQLDHIKKYKADAVVCRAINEGRVFYNSIRCFEQVINFNYMLEKGNSIVSPGQVLIRKESISYIWKSNLLKNGGADDWLLWISMLAEGKQFALNNDCLYEHMINGYNTSLNSNRMIDSDMEILQIMKRQDVFSSKQIQLFENTLNELLKQRINTLDKYKRMFYIRGEIRGESR